MRDFLYISGIGTMLGGVVLGASIGDFSGHAYIGGTVGCLIGMFFGSYFWERIG